MATLPISIINLCTPCSRAMHFCPRREAIRQLAPYHLALNPNQNERIP